MTDYTKLVEALRLCQFGECGCGKCYYKELKGDWCTEDNHPEFFDCDDKLKLDAADAIEALQAAVEWLKDSNEELRERQTYIDHYGAKWLTSAKDVPTAAYEHGYADGRDEAEAQLPKQGEWKATEMYMTDECTACGFLMNWEDVPAWLFDMPHFRDRCPNCGANMQKMEVQDG